VDHEKGDTHVTCTFNVAVFLLEQRQTEKPDRYKLDIACTFLSS